MAISNFFERVSALRFEWLETFLSVAALGSIERAAEERGIDPKNITKKISNLERSLSTILVITEPHLSFTDEGNCLVPVAIELLGILRSASSQSITNDYETQNRQLLKITVGDLYVFHNLCKTAVRKNVTADIGVSDSQMSKILGKVTDTMNVGPLLLGRYSMFLTPQGELVQSIADRILEKISLVDGSVNFQRVPLADHDARFKEGKVRRFLVSHHARVLRQIEVVKDELSRLDYSKKGRTKIEAQRVKYNDRLLVLTKLESVLHETIGQLKLLFNDWKTIGGAEIDMSDYFPK